MSRARWTKLSGVLLRRTRAEIAEQLPERTDEIIRIEATVNQLQQRLRDCIDRDEAGRPQLKITLADDNGIRELAKTLATLLGH